MDDLLSWAVSNSHSNKQYKNKLRQWGFDTKYKRHQISRKRNNNRPRRQSAIPVPSLTSLATNHHAQTPHPRSADDNRLKAPDIARADDRLFQAPIAESANGHLFEAPEAGCAVDQVFPPADAGYANYSYFQAAAAGYAVDYIVQAPDPQDAIKYSSQTPDAQDAVEYFFKAPDAQDADSQYSQAADAGSANTPNSARQASADNEENWQLSFPLKYSLNLSHAVGIRSQRYATPSIFIAERIFSSVQRHIETSFTYGFWKVDSSNICKNMSCTKEEMDLPETYFDLIRSAVLLFEQGATTEGQHVMSRAFALIKPILKSGNVRALNFFWTSVVFLIQFNHADIVVCLIRYISKMTMILLHPEHPVVNIFKLLTQIDVMELEFLLHTTWQITADAFQKELPKLHPEYVRHQSDLIFRIYGTRNVAIAERLLRQLLKDCEDTPQTPLVSHLTVLSTLGYNLMNSKDWVQAVSTGQTLEDRARQAQDIDLLVYQIGGMEIQARALKELKLIMPAVRCLKQATPLIAEQWGINDPWRIELMVLQQKWLREKGEIKEADDLKAEIKSITERIDVD